VAIETRHARLRQIQLICIPLLLEPAMPHPVARSVDTSSRLWRRVWRQGTYVPTARLPANNFRYTMVLLASPPGPQPLKVARIYNSHALTEVSLQLLTAFSSITVLIIWNTPHAMSYDASNLATCVLYMYFADMWISRRHFQGLVFDC
jgi:hypothetical protein